MWLQYNSTDRSCFTSLLSRRDVATGADDRHRPVSDGDTRRGEVGRQRRKNGPTAERSFIFQAWSRRHQLPTMTSAPTAIDRPSLPSVEPCGQPAGAPRRKFRVAKTAQAFQLKFSGRLSRLSDIDDPLRTTTEIVPL